MNQLLIEPCPFCGSCKLHKYIYPSDHYYQCDDCGAIGPSIDKKTAEEAWNGRIDLLLTGEEVLEIEGILEQDRDEEFKNVEIDQYRIDTINSILGKLYILIDNKKLRNNPISWRPTMATKKAVKKPTKKPMKKGKC